VRGGLGVRKKDARRNKRRIKKEWSKERKTLCTNRFIGRAGSGNEGRNGGMKEWKRLSWRQQIWTGGKRGEVMSIGRQKEKLIRKENGRVKGK
jgi:hypothetical protein